ncbi:MAG: chemotaxis protein CheW [Rhodospirillaceae bacterium]|jgi:purine-binding chemotaxis protein CheW|nr:chemotaxis protein CheW [Rhodospirillales bacterium]MBT3904424.1 chemotaxis protein CheW [Rhodospirillaceae bacterium]MBT4701210.1 chemotaxis protein CheW [Rhodospirillaceae bacterium]MBT5034344.1 chemotaxis protein CheW [Rhodospirillaceae bacterium]MBT6219974.1 chemotaxis protein CheW [Rhodospirillaceae bacterium]
MANDLATVDGREVGGLLDEHLEDFVTFMVGDQMFGTPILMVQDILMLEKIEPIPLAPPEVLGSINLRGRIVTVVDIRQRLGMPKSKENDQDRKMMGVTIEQEHDLYTLMVDKIGDVLSVSTEMFEGNPSTLDPAWSEFALGVYRLEGQLMVVLDVDRLLDIKT